MGRLARHGARTPGMGHPPSLHARPTPARRSSRPTAARKSGTAAASTGIAGTDAARTTFRCRPTCAAITSRARRTAGATAASCSARRRRNRAVLREQSESQHARSPRALRRADRLGEQGHVAAAERLSAHKPTARWWLRRKARSAIRKIPDRRRPNGVMNSMLDYDYGPEFSYVDGSGVITDVPPAVKQVIPTYAARSTPTATRSRASSRCCCRCRSAPIRAGIRSPPASSRARSEPGRRLHAVREDQGGTHRQRGSAAFDRRALPEPVGLLLQRDADRERRGQQRYLLPEDANRQINQLLNDMLSTGLLPKRGEFNARHGAESPHRTFEYRRLLEYLEQ